MLVGILMKASFVLTFLIHCRWWTITFLTLFRSLPWPTISIHILGMRLRDKEAMLLVNTISCFRRIFMKIEFSSQRGERSALDPICRSPFLPLWNLHKVELFSAFISQLDDISSWKCSRKCKSLQFERKNYMKDSKIQTHDLDGLVCCANHQTTEDLLEWKENNLSTYCINPNPQKRTWPVSKQSLTLISRGSA